MKFVPFGFLFKFKQIHSINIILSGTVLKFQRHKFLSAPTFFSLLLLLLLGLELIWNEQQEYSNCHLLKIDFSVWLFLQADLLWDSQKPTLSKGFITEALPGDIGKGSKTGKEKEVKQGCSIKQSLFEGSKPPTGSLRWELLEAKACLDWERVAQKG